TESSARGIQSGTSAIAETTDSSRARPASRVGVDRIGFTPGLSFPQKRMIGIGDACAQTIIDGHGLSLRQKHTSSYCGLNSLIGRTSMLPSRAGGIFEATWIASFKSLASMR